jgi:adenylate kinase
VGSIVGITGTPGTGKKSVAPLVAKKLALKCISLNEFALSQGLVAQSENEGEVDAGALRLQLRQHLRTPAVVYGHLLPYSLSRAQVSMVAVLRCEPGVLKERLVNRGYAERKVIDNVEAELIGLLSADAYDAFGKGKTFEVDTTYTSPEETAERIGGTIARRRAPKPRIDWTTNYDSGRKLSSLLSY